jgi:hypothetical protein
MRPFAHTVALLAALALLAAAPRPANAAGSPPKTATAAPAATPATARVVRFPGRSEAPDRRLEFVTALLALSLSKAPSAYRLETSEALIGPAARGAAVGRRVDVVVMPNTTTDTGGLVPVKLPLRRGLLGVRLLLARPQDAQRIGDIASIDTLKRDFRLGYGQAWLDRDAMQALGFRMVVVDHYTALFDGLRDGRFDYLSRGISELSAELGDRRLAGRGMVVVPGLALYYPLDDYFWVRPDDARLGADLEAGFRRALADGSYAALFQRFHLEAMRDIRMQERTVLHVVGYPVPPGTPLEQFDILQLTSSKGVLASPPPGGKR